MKRILLIIFFVLLFLFAGLIFWAGLFPSNFYKVIQVYPVIDNTASRIDIINNNARKIYQATSSEEILSDNGHIIISDNIWNVEIANTEEKRSTGLSNRRILSNKKGLLFVFDDTSNQFFWMKDMLFPIDMVFLDENWRIVLIEANLQPNSFPEVYGGSVKSKYVLEINALESAIYGLNVGDQAIYVNK